MNTSRNVRWIAATTLGGAVLAAAGSLLASPVERPEWRVAERHDGWEVREYAPRIEARVTVRGDGFDDAVRAGFRVLAGFIFGDNEPAPAVAEVTARPSKRIAMTAPVGAESGGQGEWVVSFVMPSKYTMETLPRPVDERVRIVEVPGGTWAATRYDGRAADDRVEQTAALLDGIREVGLSAAGPPTVAQYNPPWIPGPLRRNEILVPLAR